MSVFPDAPLYYMTPDWLPARHDVDVIDPATLALAGAAPHRTG